VILLRAEIRCGTGSWTERCKLLVLQSPACRDTHALAEVNCLWISPAFPVRLSTELRGVMVSITEVPHLPTDLLF
jgi:hypothetical protein